jgi:hypothetical protein
LLSLPTLSLPLEERNRVREESKRQS